MPGCGLAHTSLRAWVQVGSCGLRTGSQSRLRCAGAGSCGRVHMCVCARMHVCILHARARARLQGVSSLGLLDRAWLVLPLARTRYAG